MQTVYVVGNLLIDEDNLPLKIMGRLKEIFPEIKFQELDPSENMPEDKELILLDTAAGINCVSILEDIDKISSGKLYSLHDFDLGFTLKLMKKAGRLYKVKIICIPQGMNEKEAIEEVRKAINKIF